MKSLSEEQVRVFAYRVSAISLVLGFAIVGVVAFWLLYPYKVLELREGNGLIMQSTVAQGEYLRMQQNSCKFMPLSSVINRQFIDSIVYQVPTLVNSRPVGCSNKEELIYVPKTLPAGIYHISTTITFKVNPIRSVTYHVVTNNFTVIPKK